MSWESETFAFANLWDEEKQRYLGLRAGVPIHVKRFFGSVKIDATRISRDAGKLADEVVQHLAKQLMSDVEVRIEISAKAQGGYGEDVVRTVSENCRTLKFENAGFEEE